MNSVPVKEAVGEGRDVNKSLSFPARLGALGDQSRLTACAGDIQDIGAVAQPVGVGADVYPDGLDIRGGGGGGLDGGRRV